MLERTLNTQFIPGTNLRGDVAGANWVYVLPSLALARILCIGVPPRATLAALSRLGEVTIAASPRPASEPLPLDASSVDLVLLTEGVRALDEALRGEIMRVLRADGLVWAELSGPAAWLRRSSALRMLRDTLGDAAIYWLTPLAGEVHTVVPLSQPVPLRYFLDRGLFSPTLTLQRLKRARQSLKRAAPRLDAVGKSEAAEDGADASSGGLRARARQAAFGLLDGAARLEGALHRTLPAVSRHGVLAGRTVTDHPAPPAYLCDLAAARDLDLRDYRWGLWAAGAYSSRKLLFFLFPPGEDAPRLLVKMVRDPAYNDRLENEWHALERLAAQGIGEGVLPRVPFAGHHAGLAIVAETAIEGQPFRKVARWTADDPALRAGVDWLTQLGARTAAGADPRQVADALAQLAARFGAIYRLEPADARFLAERIEALRSEPGEFPLVFQHGDPGTWNVLVTPSGETAFIDWESAEPDGMPLWDLFYFLRSYVVSAARAGGQHQPLDGFAAHFLDEGALSGALADAVARYRAQVGLTAAMAETLFYTCWLHRALKQATLLPPERLDRDGHYASLLRLCIDRRQEPTLRRIFGT